MSDRELVVLGTASQVPTRTRNHSGYLLLWDDRGVLVDPGEGTQRQLIHAGVRTTRIDHVCLTHLHGDHCLGLPGVLARLSLLHPGHRVALHYPVEGDEYVQRLLRSSIVDLFLDLHLDPVERPGVVVDEAGFRLVAERLEHSAPCLGWRVEQPARRHLLPSRLAEVGLAGPAVGELVRTGRVRCDGAEVRLEDVSDWGVGQAAAFVFDTRWCDGAVALARGADLLVCESTFLSRDQERATGYGHLTAAEAGRLAAVAGAGRLVLTHFSGRYRDPGAFLEEAAAEFTDVVVAEDLMRVALPRPVRPG